MGNVNVLGAGTVTSVNGVTGPVQIGGRNFILNSEKDVVVNAKTGHEYHLSPWATDKIPAMEGRKVTLSFDYEASDDADISLLFQLHIYKPDEAYIAISDLIQLSPSKRGHYENTINMFFSEYSPNTYLLASCPPEYANIGSVTIRNLKLEAGSMATDWTPAPEDILSRLAALEAAAGITYEPPVYDGPETMDESADHAGG